MTAMIIIIFCSLILLAYVFDLTASKTKVPSVLLLLLLGWTVRQLVSFLGIRLPDFSLFLPVIGTVGLILIVLEGSLDLELRKSRIKLITKSFLSALFPMAATAIVLAYLFHHFSGYPMDTCLRNAIPFCVISSAVAIPSTKNLMRKDKEFVIYESSFSDILGVLFFTAMTIDRTPDVQTFLRFGWHLGLMVIISFLATIGLAYLLSKINHHIKFIPIIFLIILIYAVSEIYHLPALVFILLFGLFIGNLDNFKKYKWIEKLKPVILEKEVGRFRELTVEAAFLIRSLFFLLFGYFLENSEIMDTSTLLWAAGIVGIVYILRAFQLKMIGFRLKPLTYIAPRGLITILLFLSIPPDQKIPLVTSSLVTQIIILTTLIMMFGLVKSSGKSIPPQINQE